MTASIALNEHRADIRRIVAANRGANPRVFGSVARGEDTQSSDLDLLVDALPGMSLFDQGQMAMELEDLLDVPVDVITSGAGSDRFKAAVHTDAVPV